MDNNFEKGKERKSLLNRYMLGYDYDRNDESETYKIYVTIVRVIRDLLEECRINIGSKGYLYIQDSIIAIIDQRTMDIRVKTDVYPYVAHKYGVKKSENIEHGIRNALIAAYKLNKSESYDGSMLLEHFERRPTNKTFLLYITGEVYKRLWSESIEFAGV